MEWFFILFFGMIAVAAVIYAGMALRERLLPKRSVACVLETRRREKFPNSAQFVRRDKVDYILVFRTEGGERIPVTVTKAVYKAIPKEKPGILRYQGSRFLSFEAEGLIVTRSAGG